MAIDFPKNQREIVSGSAGNSMSHVYPSVRWYPRWNPHHPHVRKPFAGINGSGKHANWSIGTDTGAHDLSFIRFLDVAKAKGWIV